MTKRDKLLLDLVDDISHYVIAPTEVKIGFHKQIKEIKRELNKKNRSRWNVWARKQRRKKTSQYRLACNYRRLMREFIINGRRLKSGEKLVGVDRAYVRTWIESFWKEGMTWDNYGLAWVIDHKIPCVEFDLTQDLDVRTCFNCNNLQPLWHRDNLKKRHHVPA